MGESLAYNLRTAPAAFAAASGETGASEGRLRAQTIIATAGQTRFPLTWTPRTGDELAVCFNGTQVTKNYTWTMDGATAVLTPGVDADTEVTFLGGEGLVPSTIPAAAMGHWRLLGTGDATETDFPFDATIAEEWVLLDDAGVQRHAFRDVNYTPVIVADVTVARFLADHVPGAGVKVYGSSPKAAASALASEASTVLAQLTPWLLAEVVGHTVEYRNALDELVTGEVTAVVTQPPWLLTVAGVEVKAAAVTRLLA